MNQMMKYILKDNVLSNTKGILQTIMEQPMEKKGDNLKIKLNI